MILDLCCYARNYWSNGSSSGGVDVVRGEVWYRPSWETNHGWMIFEGTHCKDAWFGLARAIPL